MTTIAHFCDASGLVLEAYPIDDQFHMGNVAAAAPAIVACLVLPASVRLPELVTEEKVPDYDMDERLALPPDERPEKTYTIERRVDGYTITGLDDDVRQAGMRAAIKTECGCRIIQGAGLDVFSQLNVLSDTLAAVQLILQELLAGRTPSRDELPADVQGVIALAEQSRVKKDALRKRSNELEALKDIPGDVWANDLWDTSKDLSAILAARAAS